MPTVATLPVVTGLAGACSGVLLPAAVLVALWSSAAVPPVTTTVATAVVAEPEVPLVRYVPATATLLVEIDNPPTRIRELIASGLWERCRQIRRIDRFVRQQQDGKVGALLNIVTRLMGRPGHEVLAEVCEDSALLAITADDESGSVREFLLAVRGRNEQLVNAFVTRWQQAERGRMTAVSLDGVAAEVWQRIDGNNGDEVYIARTGRSLFFADSPQTLQTAFSLSDPTDPGKRLVDTETYQQLRARSKTVGGIECFVNKSPVRPEQPADWQAVRRLLPLADWDDTFSLFAAVDLRPGVLLETVVARGDLPLAAVTDERPDFAEHAPVLRMAPAESLVVFSGVKGLPWLGRVLDLLFTAGSHEAATAQRLLQVFVHVESFQQLSDQLGRGWGGFVAYRAPQDGAAETGKLLPLEAAVGVALRTQTEQVAVAEVQPLTLALENAGATLLSLLAISHAEERPAAPPWRVQARFARDGLTRWLDSVDGWTPGLRVDGESLVLFSDVAVIDQLESRTRDSSLLMNEQFVAVAGQYIEDASAFAYLDLAGLRRPWRQHREQIIDRLVAAQLHRAEPEQTTPESRGGDGSDPDRSASDGSETAAGPGTEAEGAARGAEIRENLSRRANDIEQVLSLGDIAFAMSNVHAGTLTVRLGLLTGGR